MQAKLRSPPRAALDFGAEREWWLVRRTGCMRDWRPEQEKKMVNSRIACLAVLVAAVPIALLTTSALSETASVSPGICVSIREDHCTVNGRTQEISIVKRDLRGKKYAKSVSRLIGRPICGRIVNTFAFSPVRTQLRGWQMKLRDGGRWKALYSCRL
jgi:hypothetical protein